MNDQKNEHTNIPGVIWNDDGSATITLMREINVSGEKRKSVTLQCPSTKFMRESSQKIETPAGEIEGVAELCGLAVEEVGQIGHPDYRRVQGVFACFLSGIAPNWQMPSTPSAS